MPITQEIVTTIIFSMFHEIHQHNKNIFENGSFAILENDDVLSPHLEFNL